MNSDPYPEDSQVGRMSGGSPLACRHLLVIATTSSSTSILVILSGGTNDCHDQNSLEVFQPLFADLPVPVIQRLSFVHSPLLKSAPFEAPV